LQLRFVDEILDPSPLASLVGFKEVRLLDYGDELSLYPGSALCYQLEADFDLGVVKKIMPRCQHLLQPQVEAGGCPSA
jgi:hypothetical protein